MNEQMIELPAVALRGMAVLPGMVTHFDVNRPKSVKAVEFAMIRDQRIFLVAQKDAEEDEPGQKDLYRMGSIANVKQVIKLQPDLIRVLVEGLERAELCELLNIEGYLKAKVILFDRSQESRLMPETAEAMARSLQETLKTYCTVNPKPGKGLARQMNGEHPNAAVPGEMNLNVTSTNGRNHMEIPELQGLMDLVGNNLPIGFGDKQDILEAIGLEERYECLMGILLNEINVLQIKNEFYAKVKGQVDKNQKEYILREQMKLIRQELGEDTIHAEARRFLEEAEKLDAGIFVKEKLKKEIERFKNTSANSSESTVIRGYIETLLELPWNRETKDNKDLKNAERILREEHYGLEKIKERILEFLAVRNLTEKGKSPIICLVGPPGTGKTSIARSVARSMDKKYARISLGGVRDEAEIRGHRKTYVGAMPGRLVNALKASEAKNPLILLDEIDKMSSDYKGDTASALLEVLDPEQNSKFRDHYVELPIDLSEVLFITTANSTQTIPRPLLDRMELIEVSSYTENEKAHIAKEYLIEKQMKINGLQKEQLTITSPALEKIIRGHTREAGVRNLERKIGEICRKAAKIIYADGKKQVRIKEGNLEKFLGKEKFKFNLANETDEIGIVRGLAWTSLGGDTLQIEVNIMPGKGEFRLTGQLGDVMKESAQAGISYIRSVSEAYGIDKEFFRKHDIHIHIPEGAVPKDGPSAGITMATAMLSAITKRKVKANVAMTGEITLRGRVLPIGGLKEKILAARNANIKTVCIPKKNEPDVMEISNEIKKGIQIVFAETMEDILEVALVPES